MGSDFSVGRFKKIILGDEFDDHLRGRLADVLKELGAKKEGGGIKSVVGSQDIEDFYVKVGEDLVRVESETYMGLSISGDEDVVEKIKNMI